MICEELTLKKKFFDRNLIILTSIILSTYLQKYEKIDRLIFSFAFYIISAYTFS